MSDTKVINDSINKTISKWISSNMLSTYEKDELIALSYDEKVKRFSKELKFGTAGIRGVMEMGPGSFNVYTLCHAINSFIDVLKMHSMGHFTIVVAYDTRENSKMFAQAAVECIRNRGAHAAIFNNPTPTPVLSYLLKNTADLVGINITASHNPAEYNGCKFYWCDGMQIDKNISLEIERVMQHRHILYIDNSYTGFIPYYSRADFITVKDENYETSTTTVLEEYRKRIFSVCGPLSPHYPTMDYIKVVYTNLHGSGAEIISDVLTNRLLRLDTVSNQLAPDGKFSTVNGVPNPENPEVFKLAINVAKKCGSDIIIATDPDCDRVGVMCRDRYGNYNYISANKIAVLMFKFLTETVVKDKNLEHVVVAKSYVSTPMIDVMADCSPFDIKCVDTEVGFRNIVQVRNQVLASGHNFLFGFEESCGYIAGDYCSDKDAILASLIICDMTAYYKTLGMNLFEALDSIYKENDIYYSDLTIPIELDDCNTGNDTNNSSTKIQRVLTWFIDNSEEEGKWHLGDRIFEMSTSDDSVRFENKGDIKEKIIIRRSGTEPKMKVYIHTFGKTLEEAESRTYKFKELMEDLIKRATKSV